MYKIKSFSNYKKILFMLFSEKYFIENKMIINLKKREIFFV
jgi:hypothetical protein